MSKLASFRAALLNNETSRAWARHAAIEARDCGNIQMQCYPRPIRLGWSQLEASSDILKSLLHTDTRTNGQANPGGLRPLTGGSAENITKL